MSSLFLSLSDEIITYRPYFYMELIVCGIFVFSTSLVVSSVFEPLTTTMYRIAQTVLPYFTSDSYFSPPRNSFFTIGREKYEQSSSLKNEGNRGYRVGEPIPR